MAERYNWPVGFLVNLAFLLSFLPSTIFFLIPTETQPLAIIAALPILLLSRIRITSVTTPVFVLIMLILAHMLVSFVLYPDNFGNTVLHGGSYIAPLVLFLALQDKLHYLRAFPFVFALALWVIVGFIQYFDFMAVLKGPLEGIGSITIADRFTAMPFADGGRGVSLLASEPSISAPTVLLLGLTALFMYREGKLARWATVLSVAAVLFMVFINGSATMAVLIVAVFLGWTVHFCLIRGGLSRFRAVIGMVLAWSGFVLIALNLPLENRSLVVLQNVSEYLTEGNYRDPMTFMVQIGAQRAIPWTLGFGSMIHNYGLGHGVASWTVEPVMDEVKKALGIDHYDYLEYLSSELLSPGGWAQNKPQSFFSIISFDLGVIGFLVLLWLILAVVFYNRSLIGQAGSNRLIFLVPACVWLVGFALTPLPAPWLLLAYSLRVTQAVPRYPIGNQWLRLFKPLSPTRATVRAPQVV